MKCNKECNNMIKEKKIKLIKKVIEKKKKEREKTFEKKLHKK